MIETAIEKINGSRILVIGGAGFIGSHLLESLAGQNCELISLDNYFTGNKTNHIAGVQYLEGHAHEINQLFGDNKFDYIFHFGEYSRVEQSLEEPYLALRNIYSTFPSVLQFWKNSGAKLIYSGSSTKFASGGSGAHLSPYTAAKSANTILLNDFSTWYGTDFSTVYFNNVYGGREIMTGNYATVVGKYKSLVQNKEKELPVSLPGSQMRSFTYIDDIINGVLLAAAFGQNQDYQIGSDYSYSITDLCKMFGCKPYFVESSSANRLDSKVDNHAIKLLGWKEKQNLTSHIQEFIEKLEMGGAE